MKNQINILIAVQLQLNQSIIVIHKFPNLGACLSVSNNTALMLMRLVVIRFFKYIF